MRRGEVYVFDVYAPDKRPLSIREMELQARAPTHTRTHAHTRSRAHTHTHTHTLALLPFVKRLVSCVGTRPKMVKHQARATTAGFPRRG